jgi:hypothetical protein
MPDHLEQNAQESMKASQQSLHNFFHALYERLFSQPELFGLPVTEDVSLYEGIDKKKRQDVSRKLKRPQNAIAYGIDFLHQAGQKGTLVDQGLQLEKGDYVAFFAKHPRIKKSFINGIEHIGLSISESSDAVEIRHTLYPDMMPALQALADACSQNIHENGPAFHFARCDFKALDPQYQTPVPELLRIFSPSEYTHAMTIHELLIDTEYKPTSVLPKICEWAIKYQGKRAIKSTPLFQFEYSTRHTPQVRPQIKCVSANRLVPLMSSQPEFLQKDFFTRTFPCAGAKCGWCKNKKSLEPSVLEFNGERKTICWYVKPDINVLDATTVGLVKEYVGLHEDLGKSSLRG